MTEMMSSLPTTKYSNDRYHNHDNGVNDDDIVLGDYLEAYFNGWGTQNVVSLAEEEDDAAELMALFSMESPGEEEEEEEDGDGDQDNDDEEEEDDDEDGSFHHQEVDEDEQNQSHLYDDDNHNSDYDDDDDDDNDDDCSIGDDDDDNDDDSMDDDGDDDDGDDDDDYDEDEDDMILDDCDDSVPMSQEEQLNYSPPLSLLSSSSPAITNTSTSRTVSPGPLFSGSSRSTTTTTTAGEDPKGEEFNVCSSSMYAMYNRRGKIRAPCCGIVSRCDQSYYYASQPQLLI